jgi:hypothetical protein
MQANESLFLAAGVFSLITIVCTLVFIPWIVVKLPADYFDHNRRSSALAEISHPAARTAMLVLKNLFGVLLLILGVVMLIIPGQGLLTIFIGIVLLDFPGKFRVQRWIIQKPTILNSINWLRKRRGRQAMNISE